MSLKDKIRKFGRAGLTAAVLGVATLTGCGTTQGFNVTGTERESAGCPLGPIVDKLQGDSLYAFSYNRKLTEKSLDNVAGVYSGHLEVRTEFIDGGFKTITEGNFNREENFDAYERALRDADTGNPEHRCRVTLEEARALEEKVLRQNASEVNDFYGALPDGYVASLDSDESKLTVADKIVYLANLIERKDVPVRNTIFGLRYGSPSERDRKYHSGSPAMKLTLESLDENADKYIEAAEVDGTFYAAMNSVFGK